MQPMKWHLRTCLQLCWRATVWHWYHREPMQTVILCILKFKANAWEYWKVHSITKCLNNYGHFSLKWPWIKFFYLPVVFCHREMYHIYGQWKTTHLPVELARRKRQLLRATWLFLLFAVTHYPLFWTKTMNLGHFKEFYIRLVSVHFLLRSCMLFDCARTQIKTGIILSLHFFYFLCRLIQSWTL